MSYTLKELMDERPESQRDAAEVIGVPSATLSRWINKKRRISSTEHLNAVLEYFGIDKEDLDSSHYHILKKKSKNTTYAISFVYKVDRPLEVARNLSEVVFSSTTPDLSPSVKLEEDQVTVTAITAHPDSLAVLSWNLGKKFKGIPTIKKETR